MRLVNLAAGADVGYAGGSVIHHPIRAKDRLVRQCPARRHYCGLNEVRKVSACSRATDFRAPVTIT